METKKIWTGIGSIALVLIIIMVCKGGFDKKNNETTKETTKTTEVSYTEEKVDEKNVTESNSDPIELKSFINISEEELIKNCDFTKNEKGFYPQEKDYFFACDKGVVTSITLRESQGEGYTIFDIAIADSFDKAKNKIKNQFELYSEYPGSNGKMAIFVNKDNGFTLSIEYNNDNSITGIAYSNEVIEVQEDTDEDAETKENEPLIYYSQNPDSQSYLVIDFYSKPEADGSRGEIMEYEGDRCVNSGLLYLDDSGESDWEDYGYYELFVFRGEDKCYYYLGVYDSARTSIDFNSEARNQDTYYISDDTIDDIAVDTTTTEEMIIDDNVSFIKHYETTIDQMKVRMNLECTGKTGYLLFFFGNASEPDDYEIYFENGAWRTYDGSHIVYCYDDGTAFLTSDLMDLLYGGYYDSVD